MLTVIRGHVDMPHSSAPGTTQDQTPCKTTTNSRAGDNSVFDLHIHHFGHTSLQAGCTTNLASQLGLDNVQHIAEDNPRHVSTHPPLGATDCRGQPRAHVSSIICVCFDMHSLVCQHLSHAANRRLSSLESRWHPTHTHNMHRLSNLLRHTATCGGTMVHFHTQTTAVTPT